MIRTKSRPSLMKMRMRKTKIKKIQKKRMIRILKMKNLRTKNLKKRNQKTTLNNYMRKYLAEIEKFFFLTGEKLLSAISGSGTRSDMCMQM